MTPQAALQLDQREFRDLAGRFATGVVVVTARADGHPCAMTANSFTSVCLDPPTVLVCLHRESRTARAVVEARKFGVSVLGSGQESLADGFARQGASRKGLECAPGFDIPLVPGALAWFVCSTIRSEAFGDHDVVFATVDHAWGASGQPLVFYRGRYDGLAGRSRDADWCWYS